MLAEEVRAKAAEFGIEKLVSVQAGQGTKPIALVDEAEDFYRVFGGIMVRRTLNDDKKHYRLELECQGILFVVFERNTGAKIVGSVTCPKESGAALI